ncbi:type 2 lanthipeptide synthetase LanM family protein [Lentzea sp. NPDC006480]|uniref:type 2 lanthipeptide synthetase LanM family protein n=1 Tax=Lentzea sp. NPDC006480 TaxID=3157176 RepID=UPI0033A26AC9
MGENTTLPVRAVSFERAFDDVVASAWNRLCARVSVPGWDTLRDALQDELRSTLARLARPTLVLELNVARLENRLRGETPEDRFRYYVETLLPGDWPALLAEYRGLDAWLRETEELWIGALAEMAGRLATDLPLLQRVLLPDGARLSGIRTGCDSDPHRGGRIVRILEFTCGASQTLLVYKPRPMAVDVAFQALLAYCNAGDPDVPPLPLLKVANRGSYGWSEFVAPADCPDVGAVQRFYRRQGAYLALLHVIDGVDMHHENLVAAGENPVLVDVETLFDRAVSAAGDHDDATAVAGARLRESVARTMFLPGRMWGDEQHAGVNIGGLSSGQAQLTSFTRPMWDDAGTDSMHLGEQRVEIPVAANVPRLDGVAVPAFAHTGELVHGFTSMMRFLLRHREELLRGPLRAFGEVPVRQVLRATSGYGQLLRVARHPDWLRDTSARDEVFDALEQAGADELRQVLDAERADLRQGDIPVFTATPSTRDLWDSRGVRRPDFFEHTALELVARRLEALDEREIDRQRFVVLASMSAAEPSPAGRSAPFEDSLEAAVAIGDMLVAQAIHGRRDVTWLGMEPVGQEADFQLAPLGHDLYQGTAGVALFLAHLGAITGSSRYTDLAALAAEGVRANPGPPSGGFFGLPSQLYVLAHLAALWDDPSVLPPADPVFAHLTAGVPDSEFDLVYGSAGTILGMLAWHAVTGDDRALAVAADHGRHLARHAIRSDDGAVWPMHGNSMRLLGFSHGTAGIGYALRELSRALDGHARTAELAADAFRYEDARFDPQQQNWPDLRDSNRRFAANWCNGAAGIAVSRLGVDDLAVTTAVQTVLDSPRPLVDVLCHGTLGLLLVVADAAEALSRDDWRASVQRQLGGVLAGSRCGFAHPESAPALMTGASGIGLGLLRLARPDAVPQVLRLAPPTPAAPGGR